MAMLDTVNKRYKVSQTHYTPALDSGQCHTPPTHRLCTIHWRHDTLGRNLRAGHSTDCRLLQQSLWSSHPEWMKEGFPEIKTYYVTDTILIPDFQFSIHLSISCSTVVLQCYRRQAIPTEQGKIWPFVTLYSLDRSLSNLVWPITSATPTCMPILVEFGWVGNSPRIREI